jgi:hypothetical protein
VRRRLTGGNGMRKRNRTTFDSERARLAGLRSAEARRLRAEQPLPPARAGGVGGMPGGEQEGRVPSPERLQGASKVSEPRDLHQLSEDALVDLLNSPSETARVSAARILHERSAPREKAEPKREAPRAHSLIDVLELAARAGLAISAEDVVAAIRRGELARDAERSVEPAFAAQGLRVVNEPCDVPAAPAGLRRALGSNPS